jgi:hypothetical protein
MGSEQNKKMAVKVQSIEEEEGENIRYTAVIMFIVFSASITLL